MVVFPRSVLWISSVYWSATKVACVGGGRDYFSVTEVTSEVSTEVVFVTERLRVSGRGRKWRRSSVVTSLVELVVKSCVELLRASGINILVVFSDIPVFCLDYKLPTTLKHRTRNINETSIFFTRLCCCALWPSLLFIYYLSTVKFIRDNNFQRMSKNP